MAESSVRVALLARPGPACEHLQAALQQAGAEVVLVADPLGSDAGSVAASSPGAVLVALDPAVEDVLDRYDPVLLDPAMTVIYDEADLAAKREGWDLARWTRHLAAKLAGHDDVLPPGSGIDEPPATRFEPTLAFEPSPVIEPAAVAVTPPEPEPTPEPEPEPIFEFELADAGDEAIADTPSDTTGDAGAGDSGISFSGIVPDGELALDTLEFDGDGGGFATPSPAPFDDAPQPAGAAETAPLPSPAEETPVASPAETAPSIFANLTLDEIPDDAGRGRPGGTRTWSDSGNAHGAVVVLAGIGGPDALRQFLSALPAGFARPVVVRQRLDGAKHDRLVRQLQRATALPVELAEAGHALAPGHVYVLPDGIAVAEAEDGARQFAAAEGPVPVLAGLPAVDSGILMLSGSDPAMVADALAAQEEGALVGGQSSEDCFDCEAPAALVAGGATAGTPAELASRVSTRWLSLEF